jgi:flagellar FliJ protein
MAKFKFRLQSVLNYKIQKEENKKNELGKAIQRLEAEKKKLRILESQMKKLVNEFNESAKRTTVTKLIEFNSFLSVLADRIKAQKENVNYRAQIVDKIREELLEAVKERKILEKLREKKLEEFFIEVKKSEQKISDEIVSYNFENSSAGD